MSAPPESIAPVLRQFYDRSHRKAGQTFPVSSWRDIARRFVDLYEELLKGS